MKPTLSKSTVIATALVAGAILFLGGCAKHAFAPQQSGFLSHYHHLVKVDDTTWRYIQTNRLALYNRFQVATPKIMVTEYDGRRLSPAAQQKVTDYLRESITKALSDRYPIVSSSGPDVAEIRLAITDAYKTGNRLGLTVEGEVTDSFSSYQAAAVMRTEVGEAYVGDWWDGPSAKQIIDAWSARVRQAIDLAHKR